MNLYKGLPGIHLWRVAGHLQNAHLSVLRIYQRDGMKPIKDEEEEEQPRRETVEDFASRAAAISLV